ncbi:hypothetical protein F5Y19DRAFT_240858 [Xylariaceae sp. FL1651]|nr:hypothetical protein F5Y19DRAFT_240858 [Xylariaceae sp. FL1651]
MADDIMSYLATHQLEIVVPPPTVVSRGQNFIAVARIIGFTEQIYPVKPEGLAIHSRVITDRNGIGNCLLPQPSIERRESNADFDLATVVKKEEAGMYGPAGTYLVYKLRRDNFGKRSLRLEARWSYGHGEDRRAYYEVGIIDAQQMGPPAWISDWHAAIMDDLFPLWRDMIKY